MNYKGYLWIVLWLHIFLLFGSLTAQAERRLVNKHGVTVWIMDEKTWCKDSKAYLTFSVDRKEIFLENQVELQKLIGGVRAIASFECPDMKTLIVHGRDVNGSVFNGQASESNNWILKGEMLNKEEIYTGKIKQPILVGKNNYHLGATFRELTPEEEKSFKGVMVVAVEPSSLAEDVLMIGDIITSIRGSNGSISHLQELKDKVNSSLEKKHSDRLHFYLTRKGSSILIALSLERPSETRFRIMAQASKGNMDAQGSMNAQFWLGEIYSTGRGRDDAEAKKWYKKAARQGHKGALEKLLNPSANKREKEAVVSNAQPTKRVLVGNENTKKGSLPNIFKKSAETVANAIRENPNGTEYPPPLLIGPDNLYPGISVRDLTPEDAKPYGILLDLNRSISFAEDMIPVYEIVEDGKIRGVKVVHVEPNGPSDGILKVGDIIVRLFYRGEKTIENFQDLKRQLRPKEKYKNGRRLVTTIYTYGGSKQVDIDVSPHLRKKQNNKYEIRFAAIRKSVQERSNIGVDAIITLEILSEVLYKIEHLATFGDMYSQHQLGEIYRTGRLGEKDDVIAKEWLQKAAGQGYVASMGPKKNIALPKIDSLGMVLDVLDGKHSLVNVGVFINGQALEVKGIQKEGPGFLAGLRTGNIIYRVNWAQTPESMLKELKNAKPGQIVHVYTSRWFNVPNISPDLKVSINDSKINNPEWYFSDNDYRITICDQLASHPADKSKPENVIGVKDEKIVSALAIDACFLAIRKNPSDLRFRFQLARGLIAGGMDIEALNILEDLVRKKHAPSQYYLSHLLLYGDGVKEDYTRAKQLGKEAEENGFDPESFETKEASASAFNSGEYRRPKLLTKVYNFGVGRYDSHLSEGRSIKIHLVQMSEVLEILCPGSFNVEELITIGAPLSNLMVNQSYNENYEDGLNDATLLNKRFSCDSPTFKRFQNNLIYFVKNYIVYN